MAILETKNLCYSADGREIIKDINWSVDAGEIVTITGPSGSGKTTFVRLLADLLTPTSGEVIFEGKNVADLDPIEYRRKVSYAVQQPTLFGNTVKDNLEFPYQIRNKPFNKDHALRALQTVDLGDGDLDRTVDNLSGGERQRVALIRNIMFVPEVLILDEVTTGLDEKTKASVHKMINYINQRDHTTIIMITHDQDEIDHATELVTIVDGRLVKGDKDA